MMRLDRTIFGMATVVVLNAGQAAAQSGCQMVSEGAFQYYAAQKSDYGTSVAEGISALDGPVLLQAYADLAREGAKQLDGGKGFAAPDLEALDNLMGVIDCFITEQSRMIVIEGVSAPFTERFSETNRLALLEALYANDATAPVIQYIKGGNC